MGPPGNRPGAPRPGFRPASQPGTSRAPGFRPRLGSLLLAIGISGLHHPADLWPGTGQPGYRRVHQAGDAASERRPSKTPGVAGRLPAVARRSEW